MLFRKKIPHSCQYCVHSTKFTQDQMLCSKEGVVSVTYECRKFKYDPLKRIPPKHAALDPRKYDDEDYSL